MLQLKNICLEYNNEDNQLTQALDNLSIDVKEGEFAAVVGPSGCGKSTLLNICCGILKPTKGEVFLNGSQVVAPIKERVGYVFQRDMLLPWKTVFENVALALRIHNLPEAEVKSRVEDWLNRVGLSENAQDFPSQLSGGMRQRAAIAGTLVYEPNIILMDEPFSALDAQTRHLLQEELLNIWEGLHKTVLFVTHDLEEAIVLADKVFVLKSRPATVKTTYTIDLKRPRNLDELRHSQRFNEIFRHIWLDLKEEVRS